MCIHGSSFNGLTKPASSTASDIISVCLMNCTNELSYNAIFSFHPGTGGMNFCDGSATHGERGHQRLRALQIVHRAGTRCCYRLGILKRIAVHWLFMTPSLREKGSLGRRQTS